MSTATATILPNISHLPHNPHTAHPLPLREQAFTLHCQGLRSPAIAQQLGVPERTIRAWIASALDDLKVDLNLNRREQLLLAVEHQHQLTAAAWQQFEREAAARDALLDATLASLHTAAADATTSTDSTASSTRPVTVHLPASSLAPRYLSLILQANKEANRLLGLHTLAHLQLLSPEPDPTDSEIPAESATAKPAQTATIFESAKADFAAAGPPGAVSTAGSAIPAESATAPTLASGAVTAPLLRGEGVGGEVPSPAKTATAADEGLAAGLQPANPRPTMPASSAGTSS